MGYEEIQTDQGGVITRAQLLGSGLGSHHIKRLVARRELARVHRGVYVAHTGALTWQERAWAAVLATAPSALCLDSALRAHEGPGLVSRDEQIIHVAVAEERHVAAPSGVLVHRLRDLDSRVLWNLAPPRMRYEEAALDVAVRAPDEFAALEVLARAVGSRRTTAQRMLAASDRRPRLARRGWIEAVLADIAEGTCSVLEHGYLTRVERAHGLPTASRQRRDVLGRRVRYRDAAYDGLVIELDGRFFHDSTRQRDRDAERDLDLAVQGAQTLRILWGQVFRRPCSTAYKIASILHRRGLAG